MKNIYLYTLLFGILGFGLISCETDKEPVLSVKANAELEAMPQSDYVFNAGNATDPFVIKWKLADFGFTPVNTYTVVLKNKANGNTVTLGTTSGNELQLTNSDINTYAGNVYAYPGKTTDMSISLSYSAYNGQLDSIAKNEIDIKVTPYDPKTVEWDYIYVAEGYPNWDFNTAYLLGDIDGDGRYEGFVDFIGAGTATRADGITYAVLDGKTLEVLSENNVVSEKGFYHVIYDGTATVSNESLEWGVIGDATPGGWDTDTMLEYDPDTRLWTKVATLLVGKEFKFRANSDWGVNLGAIDPLYQENLEGDLAFNGPNFRLAYEKDTTFLITVNLADAGKYTYKLEAVEFEQSSQFITMPGGYQNPGWQPTAADCYRLESPGRDFIYSGAHYMPANTEFKFWDNNTWIGIDGNVTWNTDKTQGSFTINLGGGGNIQLDKGDFYKFTVNTKKLTCQFIKSGWGLVGAGAPTGDWNEDTMMDYDPVRNVWTVTATLLGGEMKFRWDRGWDKNLGGSLGALVYGGDNLNVPAGTYTIVLDEVAMTATMTAN